MKCARGFFIVFEGCDFSGKTTQSNILYDELIKLGHKCEKMRYPDRKTVIGKLINEYLKSGVQLDDHVIHLLFSANRWEKNNKVENSLKAGYNIIMDRYAYSGVAFSSSKANLDLNWCKMPDVGLVAPDLVIYLDVFPETISNRQNFGEERYETLEFQKKVHSQYNSLFDPNWKIIDANQPLTIVSTNILREVNAFIQNFAESKPFKYLWT